MGKASFLKEKLKQNIEKIDGLEIDNDAFGEGLYFVKKDGQTNRDFVWETFFKKQKKLTEAKFNDLYDQAIGGNGKEDRNMNNAMSSALFAFLFFSNVSDDNPIILDDEYINVFFEYKNRTLDGNTDFAPSNIDVVLANKDFSKLMFIESKFGEYYYSQTKKYDKLSIRYGSDSKTKAIVENLIKYKDNKIVFKDNVPHYYEGLKQMITHISGLSNFISGNFYSYNSVHLYDKEKQDIQDKFEKGKTNIVLQEIVFNFENFGIEEKEKKDYEELHEKIVGNYCESQLQVRKLKTYQDIASDNKDYIDNLPEKIKELYKL